MSQIYQYVPGKETDYLLLQWLENMRHSGELSKTISSNYQHPTAFLQFFQQPRLLYFKLDSLDNISHTVWLEPCMGSYFLGYWVHPAARGRLKEKVDMLYMVIDLVFQADVSTIAGFIQERPTPEETCTFIKIHERLGYTYRGFVPGFFEGKDCHIVAITPEGLKDNGWWKRWRREHTS
jgi:hypothetical protein